MPCSAVVVSKAPVATTRHPIRHSIPPCWTILNFHHISRSANIIPACAPPNQEPHYTTPCGPQSPPSSADGGAKSPASSHHLQASLVGGAIGGSAALISRCAHAVAPAAPPVLVATIAGTALGAVGIDLLFGGADSRDYELDYEQEQRVDADVDKVVAAIRAAKKKGKLGRKIRAAQGQQ